jgi:hypothetical protein
MSCFSGRHQSQHRLHRTVADGGVSVSGASDPTLAAIRVVA